MMRRKRPVLDGLPCSDDRAEEAPTPRRNTPRHGFGTCPECLAEFEKHHANSLFCQPTHRRAFNNRMVVRGAVLAPLAIVARKTRNGTRGDRVFGAKASSDADTLARRWEAEDAAEGRMPMTEYMRLRYLNGFDPL